GVYRRPFSFTLRCVRLKFHHKNLFRVIDLGQFDFDYFVQRGLYMASHEAGLNGYLAMSSINQHAELYAPRPAMGKQSIQRGPGCASGEKNIVHEHDILIFNRETDLLVLHYRFGTERRKIIAIKSNV